MRVKDIYSVSPPEQPVHIEVPCAEASDWGSMESMNETYGRYFVKEIKPVWDVIAGVARLRLVLQPPPRPGRTRKKAEL